MCRVSPTVGVVNWDVLKLPTSLSKNPLPAPSPQNYYPFNSNTNYSDYIIVSNRQLSRHVYTGDAN